MKFCDKGVYGKVMLAANKYSAVYGVSLLTGKDLVYIDGKIHTVSTRELRRLGQDSSLRTSWGTIDNMVIDIGYSSVSLCNRIYFTAVKSLPVPIINWAISDQSGCAICQ